MRRILLATLLAASAIGASASTPKEQLLVAPAGARHYTISSIAGKHGDVWSWKLPDGRLAYRMSMSLRGWVTETDEVMTLGADGRPTAIAIRGYHRFGRRDREFHRRRRRASRAGRPRSTRAPRRSRASATTPMAARGWPARWTSRRWSRRATRASTCCPSGHASITIGAAGPDRRSARARRRSSSPSSRGYGFSPSPVWLDADNRFFGNAGHDLAAARRL